MRGLLLVLAALSPLSAHAATVPTFVAAGQERTWNVTTYGLPPDSVTCGNGIRARVQQAAPLPAGVWQTWVLAPGAVVYASATPQKNLYAFSIDAEGRVVDLKTPQGRAYQAADRQAATVATWRFAPGTPATGCQVEQTPDSVLIAQASPARLFEILAHEGRKTLAVVRQTLATEGNCVTAPRRRPQVIVYPDLRAFDDRTTDPSWAGLRYDIDADGLVRNVRIVAQYGEASFADTAASSVAEARFFPGAPRTGCLATFKAIPRATEAPPIPSAKNFERPGDVCHVTREMLSLSPRSVYPIAYTQRRVAGWAIMRFEVTPSGQVIAPTVLAAQPSATFGVAASNLLRTAHLKSSADVAQTCVVPIVFAIPPTPDEDN